MLVWHAAAFTHRGRVRAANEDGVAIEDRILTEDMAAPTTLTITNDVCVLMIAEKASDMIRNRTPLPAENDA